MPSPPGRIRVIRVAASSCAHEPTPAGGTKSAAKRCQSAGIVPAQRLDPALFGRRAGRLHRIEHKQRAGPPADLVVGEIADPIGVAAIGRDELAGERHHPGCGRRRERIEPVEARLAAELEVDDRRQAQDLRRERPAAGAVEPPGREPPSRGGDPLRPGRVERGPAVPDLAVLAAVGIAAIERVDAEAEKALAAGRHQPGDAVIGGERPARGRRSGQIRASQSAGRPARRQYCGERQRPPTAAEPHDPPRGPQEAAVAGGRLRRWCRRRSARPCAGSAGRRRPARSARPCRRCRCRRRAPRSLPIIVTLVSASGPLPISVAPLTAGPTLPFSIR